MMLMWHQVVCVAQTHCCHMLAYFQNTWHLPTKFGTHCIHYFWFILIYFYPWFLIDWHYSSCTHVLYEIPIIYVLCSSMPQRMEFMDAFFRYTMLQLVQKFSHYTMKPKLTIIYVIRRHLTAMMIWCSTMVCSGMCSLARYERTTFDFYCLNVNWLWECNSPPFIYIWNCLLCWVYSAYLHNILPVRLVDLSFIGICRFFTLIKLPFTYLKISQDSNGSMGGRLAKCGFKYLMNWLMEQKWWHECMYFFTGDTQVWQV